MIGGCFYLSTSGLSPSIELFNNAHDGSALHLYRIISNAAGAGPYYITRQTGTQGGTIVPSYPVVSSGSQQPGQINYTDVASSTYPRVGPVGAAAMIVLQNYAADNDYVSTDGPFCVLVPGDSIRVVNPYQGTEPSSQYLSATFLWLAIRDLG
jgi:hypothetical protein